MALIAIKVFLALTPSGARKSETPSEIASRPVSEEPPFAKARSKINIAAKLSKPLAWPISTAPLKVVGSYFVRVPANVR